MDANWNAWTPRTSSRQDGLALLRVRVAAALLSRANRETIPNDMEPTELPLIVRKPIWPVAAVVVAATAGAVYLVRIPNIYSDPLRFGGAFVL